jgi:hypothetical protein
MPMPTQDPFYLDPIPPRAAAGASAGADGSPGEIVRSRTSIVGDDPFSGNLVPDVNSWQVLYRSTDTQGHSTVVSGTVIVPTTPWTGPGPRPLVSWGPGTRGLGDACAPSFTLAIGTDYELGPIKLLLRKGYAVAVTDYEGLGIPGEQHTYMAGKSQGHAALDIVRAALQLPGAGLGPDTPVGLYGYSQGATTAAWAAEVAPSYAPELNLVGAAFGGLPSNLLDVSTVVDGSLWVSFGLIAAVGYDAEYPDLHLADYLNDKGRAVVERTSQFCLVGLDGLATFLDVAGSRMTDYVNRDPRLTPVWKKRLAQNLLGSSAPKAPVFQYQGGRDQIAPRPQARTAYESWCRKGANVTWAEDTDLEHVAGFLAAILPSFQFLDDRFAGVPVTGTCKT